MTNRRLFAVAALLFLALSASLAGCGKKGPLDAPPPREERSQDRDT